MAENIICVMACLVLLEDFMLLKEHVLKERFFCPQEHFSKILETHATFRS